MTHLEYEAYEPLAVRGAGADRRGGPGLLAGGGARLWHHRIGRLAIGEASIVIAAASPHRADAFAACRYAIERVKQIVPIWKHEFFEGGEVWIEGATADPSDEAARRAALDPRDAMRVTVRLFARLRDIAGTGELVRDVPPGATPPERLATAWSREFPALGDYERVDFGGGQRRLRGMDGARWQDGDEVAFLPPVSGG